MNGCHGRDPSRSAPPRCRWLSALVAAGVPPAARASADGPPPRTRASSPRADVDELPQPRGLRLPAVLAAQPPARPRSSTTTCSRRSPSSASGSRRTGDIDMAWRGSVAYVSDNAVAVTNAAHAKGVRVVPTFQLFDSGSLTEDDRVPRQHRCPGPVHRPGARPDGPPLRRRRELRLRADAGVDDRRSTSHSSPASTRRWTPVSPTRRSSTRPPPARRRTLDHGPRPDRRPAVRHDLQLPLERARPWPARSRRSTTRRATSRSTSNRFMAYAPKESLILGVPYYGYDWPVTSTVPNATVRADKTKYGAGQVGDVCLGARPSSPPIPTSSATTTRSRAAASTTYWDTSHLTYRQVYFEDERSAAAKYEYAITTGLGGRRDLDARQRRRLHRDARTRSRSSTRPTTTSRSRGSIRSLARLSGIVYASLAYSVKNVGDVPERGPIRWQVRNEDGRHGRPRDRLTTTTVSIGQTAPGRRRSSLGSAAELPSGHVDGRGVLRHARRSVFASPPSRVPPALLSPVDSATQNSRPNLETTSSGSGVSRPCDSSFRLLAATARTAAMVVAGTAADPRPPPGHARGPGRQSWLNHITSRAWGLGTIGRRRPRRSAPTCRGPGERVRPATGPRRAGARRGPVTSVA